MKKIVVLGCLLLGMVFSFGCTWSQLGETTAEGDRRHQRVVNINRQQLNEDIDYFFLMDQPSRLSDKRIP